MQRRIRLAIAAILVIAPLALCARIVARDVQGRKGAAERLAQLEAAMTVELPPGASPAAVLSFLNAHGVPYPEQDARQVREGQCPSFGIQASLGEWRGPVFQRALFVYFEFDKDCRLAGHRSQEVEGS